jgi:hypothetical protein
MLQWKAIIITYSERVFVVLSYPACTAHATYCHTWLAWLCKRCPHYIKKGTIFGRKKQILNIHVFRFSVQLLSETFRIFCTTVVWDISHFLYKCCLRHFAFSVQLLCETFRFSVQLLSETFRFSVQLLSETFRIFCTTVVWDISHFKNWAKYD